MEFPRYVFELIERIESFGEEAYVVGGGLRDIILNKAPNDFDVTTSALPEKTVEIFSDKRVILTGMKHGTVTVLWEGEPVEITTFRVDGDYSDSRHPDKVSFTGRIEEDLARRDFTVNAMAYNKKRGIVDPFGGRDDLEKGIIRAVGDPKKRFSEDALRILRAFRFSAQLSFSIHPDTLAGAESEKDRLASIARERVSVELLKLITSDSPELPLTDMIKRGIMPYVLGAHTPRPEVIERLRLMPREDHARLGFLLAGADRQPAEDILHSLKLSAKQIKGALAVLRGSEKQVLDRASARRLISECGIYAPAAAAASALLGNSAENAPRLVALEADCPRSVSDLPIGGRELMEMGARGKEIGEILEALLRRAVDDPALGSREALLSLAAELIAERRA